jgi:hypothetical protein
MTPPEAPVFVEDAGDKALKSLIITLNHDVTDSCISSFRIDIVTKLEETASLESLSFQNIYDRIETMEADEYIELVSEIR